jgi:hypothetical protein
MLQQNKRYSRRWFPTPRNRLWWRHVYGWSCSNIASREDRLTGGVAFGKEKNVT